uniref:40S ribosomal protein S7 n=1 Tax=Ornithorhynchus anatinus TaxID=9258 RepID=A0A6I8N996_ORNAN
VVSRREISVQSGGTPPPPPVRLASGRHPLGKAEGGARRSPDGRGGAGRHASPLSPRQEIEVGGGRKAIIIFVPVPQLKSFQKIQVRLVRELEKKFSGKHVVFIAQRRILPKPTRKSRTKNKQKRPRSRTLTAVHDAILEDLVFPSEIVGKRIRVKLDGSRLIKVHLDKAQQNNVEHKVETFSGVYKKLTGKDVNFEFPEFQL